MIENLNSKKRGKYQGEITIDRYGRKIPKHAHVTINLDCQTSSTRIIMEAVTKAYDETVDKSLLIRRINITANKVVWEDSIKENQQFKQLDFFTDYNESGKENVKEKESLQREKNMQKAMIDIKKRFGKNAVLKGMNLEKGATAKDRNAQIGGHKA